MEYQGVHGGVSDEDKVMGHVGMCEDTTSERELRKTGMSSLSHASPYVGLCRYCVGTMSVLCRRLRRYFVGILSETMSDYPAILFAPLWA